MDILDLVDVDSTTLNRLLDYNRQRFSLAQSIADYLASKAKNRTISLELAKICEELYNACSFLLIQFQNPNNKEESKTVPYAMFLTKTRLDPVWNFIHNSYLDQQWRSNFKRSIEGGKRRSALFELKVPQMVNGKEFFESDVSDVFKKIRKLPGWKKCVENGKFYTSTKRDSDQLLITIRCVAIHNSKLESAVISRYANYFFKKILKIKPNDDKTGSCIKYETEILSNLSEKTGMDYLMNEEGKWDIELIEKLIKKGCLSLPRIYTFGKMDL